MFPGLNPKKMQAVMKQMGIAQIEIPTNKVIIDLDILPVTDLLTGDFFNAPGLSFESGESIIASDGFSSSKDIIDEPFVKGIMKKGYEYHVWTVNDSNTAMRFKKWGAKSITTDDPEYIKKSL